MLESELSPGARDKLALIETAIADLESVLDKLHAELKEKRYRAGGEMTPAITTLNAMIQAREMLLDNHRQTLGRHRVEIARLPLPSNSKIVDVVPPVPADGETLESVRAALSAKRGELGELQRAPASKDEMLPLIAEFVEHADDPVRPPITRHGAPAWGSRSTLAAFILGAGSKQAAIKKFASFYAAQLEASGIEVARDTTRLAMLPAELDELERLEEVLVMADPNATRKQNAKLLAFLGCEIVTRARRAA